MVTGEKKPTVSPRIILTAPVNEIVLAVQLKGEKILQEKKKYCYFKGNPNYDISFPSL